MKRIFKTNTLNAESFHGHPSCTKFLFNRVFFSSNNGHSRSQLWASGQFDSIVSSIDFNTVEREKK